MGKIDNLENYIKQCDTCIEMCQRENTTTYSKELQENIISIYAGELPNIRDGLDNYSMTHMYDNSPVDYIGDIKKIKAKLINYRDDIELKEQKEIREFEVLKLKQSSFNINNQNTSTNTLSTTINITIDMVQETIQSFPDDVLSAEDKEELEDKLAGIEAMVNKNDKDKIKQKIGNVLKFALEKGTDVAIAILPYLGKAAGIALFQ
ncbi:hypothetical protein [[Clostridium] fimetarium]|uniref:Uncharacterized protein n=1 Tax=[Clostridium] fimetarium TaxID=99656 RepID=A0A1I0QVJ4_9FIRM|nr:hypothetical protein [[Clostridium] fimetarium]SEW31435.1 hypothetical protein SAMN05421659_109148 [[Clostridium] fimetarium]